MLCLSVTALAACGGGGSGSDAPSPEQPVNSFAKALFMPVANPSDVEIVDLDQDGELDFVITSFDQNAVIWNRGLGGERYQQIELSTAVPGAGEVAVGDIDNDADLDIVVVSLAGRFVGAFLNNGDGSFAGDPGVPRANAKAAFAGADASQDLSPIVLASLALPDDAAGPLPVALSGTSIAVGGFAGVYQNNTLDLVQVTSDPFARLNPDPDTLGSFFRIDGNQDEQVFSPPFTAARAKRVLNDSEFTALCGNRALVESAFIGNVFSVIGRHVLGSCESREKSNSMIISRVGTPSYQINLAPGLWRAPGDPAVVGRAIYGGTQAAGPCSNASAEGFFNAQGHAVVGFREFTDTSLVALESPDGPPSVYVEVAVQPAAISERTSFITDDTVKYVPLFKGLGLADVDGDGDCDLTFGGRDGVSVFKNGRADPAPPPAPPSAAFAVTGLNANNEAVSGSTLSLDGSASMAVAQTAIQSYRFSVTRPNNLAVEAGGGETAQLTLPNLTQPAELTISLQVTDGNDQSDTLTQTFNLVPLPNTPPMAHAGPDQTVDPDSAVSLDGSASADAETASANLTYSWTQASGTDVSLTGQNTSTPSFTSPNAAATLVFELTVTDAAGATATDSVTITVTAPNLLPTADAGPDQQVDQGVVVEVNCSNSSDAGGSIQSYEWQQISGPEDIAFFSSFENRSMQAVDQFEAPFNAGDYVFRCTVTDDDNLQGEDTVTITIR